MIRPSPANWLTIGSLGRVPVSGLRRMARKPLVCLRNTCPLWSLRIGRCRIFHVWNLCGRMRREFPGFYAHLILLSCNTDEEQVSIRGIYHTKEWFAASPRARGSWSGKTHSCDEGVLPAGCCASRKPLTAKALALEPRNPVK